MFYIGTHVADEYLKMVRGRDYAHDMFEALRKVHGTESGVQIVNLRANLATYKFVMGGELLSYIVKFRSVYRRLHDLGDVTPTRQSILSLLKSLASYFYPIRAVLENKVSTVLTWDFVTCHLTKFYNQLKGPIENKKSEVVTAGAGVEAKPEIKLVDKVIVAVFSNGRRSNFNHRGNSNNCGNANNSQFLIVRMIVVFVIL